MPRPPTKSQVQAENDRLKKQLAEAESAIEELEGAAEAMSSTLDESRKKRTEMDRAHRETLSDLEKMTANFINLKRELADTKKALESAEEEIKQNTHTTPPQDVKPMSEMKFYTKYSDFMENTLDLGRNGKRAVHGGAAAAGTWAAGTYGGIEIISQNMPVAMGVGAAVGFLGTVALDKMVITPEEEAKLIRSRATRQEKKTLEVLAEQLPELMAELQKKAS
jgi:myosin heavy subunit